MIDPTSAAVLAWCAIGVAFYIHHLREEWLHTGKLTAAQLLSLIGFLLAGGLLPTLRIVTAVFDFCQSDKLSKPVFMSRKREFRQDAQA